MAAGTKATVTVLHGGASDSEDDLATVTQNHDHSSTGAENKRTASKTNKAKSGAQRAATGKTAVKRKASAQEPRQALQDRTNLQDENAAGILEDAGNDEHPEPKAKRAKTTTKSTTTGAKRGRPPKRVPAPEPLSVIPELQPELQPDVEDVEQSIEVDDEVETAAVVALPPIQTAHSRPTAISHPPLQPRPSVRAGSAQPAYPPSRERSGSVNGNDRRGGDPELRRQFNELSKAHENLKLKLESLQEIGKNQAETNFEKLKRASDQKARDATDLIASLRKELAELRKSTSSASSETSGLQKQITTLTTSNEKLRTDSEKHSTERDALKSQLTVARNEVKSLEAKLTTTRQQLSNSAKEAKERELAAAASSTTTSTLKSGPRHAAAAAADTFKEKEAQMVQNLYSDLTGLVILGAKRKDGEDEFDCLQTGRNGTLHFHLSIANDPTAPHPKTPSGMRYEDAEFAYEPLLDANRDRDLLALLPDYLTEDICFPRAHAQKFYGKVVESITRNVLMDGEREEEEEDDDEDDDAAAGEAGR